VASQPDDEGPPGLADHVDSALRALWHGNSAPLDELVSAAGSQAPGIGELLGDLAAPAPSTQVVALPSDALPGYTVLSEIGRGGMGVVYDALQEGTNRKVAVKVMLAGPFASPAARTRFQREVELTARLQHPGIVRVLESKHLPNGLPYYAMDYVEGVTLNRYLAGAGLGTSEIVGLFIQLCAAVQYAHDHGVIHRDLKPSNILVDEEGQPHIVDFGLAKALDAARTDTPAASVSMPDQIVGTLRYLSPEQAAGQREAVDERTDVYTLGVMLFEAVTGAMPYDTSGQPSSALQRIIADPPLRPSSLAPRVERDLETIILKALEKEPARRYASVAELGEDLSRYLAGEPIHAQPPSLLYVLRKKVKKHRWPVLVSATVLILVVGGLAAGLWAHERLLESQDVEAVIRIDRYLRRGDYLAAVRARQPVSTDSTNGQQARLLRGHAYLCLGKTTPAIEDYTKAAEYYAPQGDVWPYYHRATARWMGGDLEGAAADYREFLRVRPDHQYAATRLYLALHDQAGLLEKNGRAGEAQEALRQAEEVLAHARAHAEPGSWMADILACIARELLPQDLVAQAASKRIEEQCEAYYYAGEVCLLVRQPDEARQWFEKCLKTDCPVDRKAVYASPMSEWHLARWRLDQLSAAPATQPPPEP